MFRQFWSTTNQQGDTGQKNAHMHHNSQCNPDRRGIPHIKQCHKQSQETVQNDHNTGKECRPFTRRFDHSFWIRGERHGLICCIGYFSILIVCLRNFRWKWLCLQICSASRAGSYVFNDNWKRRTGQRKPGATIRTDPDPGEDLFAHKGNQSQWKNRPDQQWQ